MEKFLKTVKNECGQALVLSALMIAVVVGMAALIVDLGGGYIAKSDLQNAADAAALAGVAQLPKDPNGAKSLALNYAQKNCLLTDTVTTTIGDGGYSIKVGITRNVPFTLAKLFGTSSKEVSVDATAATGYASTVPEIVPFAVGLDQINKLNSKEDMWDHQYTMRLPPDDSQVDKGYDIYEMDYCNVVIKAFTKTNQYINALTYGYDQTFTIGQNMYYYAPSEGGASAIAALAKRMTDDPVNDYTQAYKGEARVMLVPVVYSIYYQTDANGNYKTNGAGKRIALKRPNEDTDFPGDQMPIIGFVALYLQDIEKKTTTGWGGHTTTTWASGDDWRGYVRFLKDFNIGGGTAVTPNETYYFGILGSGLIK
ncbi:MAG: Tad domain-containing protein [Syntrophomonadaceae bacterium]|nr:Tad domain-containing protein [Syntrophomonadaceae bacterium]